jgi:hypothetical protein
MVRVGDEVGCVDGVALVLDSVELIEGCPVVKLAGVRNARTRALDAEHDRALEAWAQQVRRAARDGEPTPAPPAQPGELLRAVAVSVQDDAGTTYTLRGTAFGGTGTEWDGVWRFHPTVPAHAKQLVIRLEAPDAEASEHSLLL